MLKYILNRLLLVIPTILVVIFIVFFILTLTPGTLAEIILGSDASEEEIHALNDELGFYDPLIVRYFNYLKGVLSFDFGESYLSPTPAYAELVKKFPFTLRLGISSIVVSALIGIPLGVISAIKQYSFMDISLTVGALILASTPGFVLGLLMVLVFSLKLGWLPPNGIGSIKHYIMPVLTLSLSSAAFLARMTRTSMLETLRQDYIRTAKAKGVPKKLIITRHALKSALMPVITILGTKFAGTLGGAMITEQVFGLPGVGSVILAAIQGKDIPVIMVSVIFLGVAFKLIMLLVDVTYFTIDPRLSARFK